MQAKTEKTKKSPVVTLVKCIITHNKMKNNMLKYYYSSAYHCFCCNRQNTQKNHEIGLLKGELRLTRLYNPICNLLLFS